MFETTLAPHFYVHVSKQGAEMFLVPLEFKLETYHTNVMMLYDAV